MIWSCEINYSGWEDDIHHHHFFIEDDTKPSERAVVDCYNANYYYDPDNLKATEHIEPLEDDEDFNWQAVGAGGYSYDNVKIIIKPLKVYITKSGEIRWG